MNSEPKLPTDANNDPHEGDVSFEDVDSLPQDSSEAGDTPIVYTTKPSRRIVGFQPHGQGDGPIYARD